jgi:hypothetical protein
MAAKVPAAQNRMFKNVFICKNCSQKMKVSQLKILGGKVKCRKCGRKDFRVIKKK